MAMPSTTATGGGETALVGGRGGRGLLSLAAGTQQQGDRCHGGRALHGELKNCVIWFLYTRKRRLMADMADRPGAAV